MIIEQSQHIIDEVSKVFIGKDEIIKKVLMTIYAGGHILLNDAPGTGKTTLALAFSKALGLDYKRIQFTTDTLPSDIVGFTMLNNETQKFEFRPGAVFSNLLLVGDKAKKGDRPTDIWALLDNTTVEDDQDTWLIPKSEISTKILENKTYSEFYKIISGNEWIYYTTSK